MAKRRNQKKEKAERNKAYARQFRKKSNHLSSRFRSRRRRQESTRTLVIEEKMS